MKSQEFINYSKNPAGGSGVFNEEPALGAGSSV